MLVFYLTTKITSVNSLLVQHGLGLCRCLEFTLLLRYPLSNLLNVFLCKYMEIIRCSIRQRNNEYKCQIESMQAYGVPQQWDYLQPKFTINDCEQNLNQKLKSHG